MGLQVEIPQGEGATSAALPNHQRMFAKQQSPSRKLSSITADSNPHMPQQQGSRQSTAPSLQAMQTLAMGKGKLGSFVTLNVGRLESKLLEEQRQAMEQEQEQLLAQWAAPTRGAQASVRNLQEMPSVSRNSMTYKQRQSSIGPHDQAGSVSAHSPRPTSYAGSIRRYSGSGMGSPGLDQVAAMQTNNTEAEAARLQADTPPPRVVRPDIINSTSTRFLEYFNEAKQMRLVSLSPRFRAKATASTPQMPSFKRRVNCSVGTQNDTQIPNSVFLRQADSAGRPFQLDDSGSMRQLQGPALISQALVTIHRAERLLERLKDSNDPLDSRPGTSPGELAVFEQQLQMLKDTTHTSPEAADRTSPNTHEGHRHRRVRREASVWSKGLEHGGMLRSLHNNSRIASKRHGVSGPRSLAMSFVDSLSTMDDWSLVSAARQRLELVKRYERLADMQDEREATDKEEQYQLGLMIAEHILQELQSHLANDKSAVTAPAANLASPSTAQILSPKDNAASSTGILLPPTQQSPRTAPPPEQNLQKQSLQTANDQQTVSETDNSKPTFVTEVSMAMLPREDGCQETSLQGLATECQGSQDGAGGMGLTICDSLCGPLDCFGSRIEVILSTGEVVKVPQTPDGAKFSGAFGKAADFRKRQRHVRAAVIQHNPVAFQEEVAEMAEAQYRALAERARIRYITQSRSKNEPKLVDEFMKAVKYLASDRPYFLPPLAAKDAVRRPQKQAVRKAAPDWVVDGSIYENRKRENEARDVYDTERVKAQQFSLDWQRVVSKTRFRRLVGRVDQGVKTDDQRLELELKEVRMEMLKYREELRSIFTYYACQHPKLKSDDLLVMSMSMWLQFCTDSKIQDNSQPGCSLADLQTVFVSVNYEEEKDTMEADANDDDAMMRLWNGSDAGMLCMIMPNRRFEFFEGLVRAAFGKFIQTGILDDASDAVAAFMEDIVLPNMPPAALLDCNDFRRKRLYCKEMHDAVSEWFPLLQAMHRIYRAKDHTKHFWIEHWAALLDTCKLLGPHTGLERREAKQIFCWSQMIVTDELKRRKRALSLTLFDFIEAIARVADMLALPMESDIDAFLQLRTKLGMSDARARRNGTGDGVVLSNAGSEDTVWTGYAAKVSELFKSCIRDPSQVTRARRKSAGLLTERNRPLNLKFNSLMQYLLACMREQWGGRSMEDCGRRMMKMANVVSGGIEMS